MLEDEQTKKIIPGQYPELADKFSADLLKYATAQETAQGIASICLEFGIKEEEKIQQICYFLTLVLFDQLSLNEFREFIEDQLKIDPVNAEKMVEVIRKTLIADKEIILKSGSISGEKPTISQEAQKTALKQEKRLRLIPEKKPEVIEEERPPQKKDMYREPVE